MVTLHALDDLEAAGEMLEGAPPECILEWAVDRYGSRLAMSTAFGAEGCALIAMLAELGDAGKAVRIFNLDTGYQFPETLETRERILRKYGIRVELVRPEESEVALAETGERPLFATHPEECCRLRKVVPMRRALAGAEAWITGIRRDQTKDRATARPVQWDERFGLAKVSPLAGWTRGEVWTYIRLFDVPYNPLHDQGYTSIGCWPCTRAVRPGEPERAGRWAGTGRTECGIHSAR